ncbi:MAG: hydroxyacid dehydrogenase [bacterium]
MRKKVLIVQPIHESGIKLLRKEVDVILAPDSSVETVCKEIKGIHGVIVRTAPFTREIIESADKLEVIGRHGVGIDNIDIEAASRRGIPVVNTPNANMVSVAEHTMGFILALAKRLVISDKATRGENFAIREEFAAVDLDGKTLGIVGAGRVGSTLAKKCKAAFNMRLLAYDPYLSPEKAKEMGVSLCDSLPELLKESDFVSIHVPLTKDTRDLIGEKELKLMKPTAFLINVARGGIVGEKALAKALKEKWIAGAATDVFSQEPPAPDNPLLKIENIILSPHMAALTKECVIRMATGVAEGVLDVLRGNKPKYIANLDFL